MSEKVSLDSLVVICDEIGERNSTRYPSDGNVSDDRNVPPCIYNVKSSRCQLLCVCCIGNIK